MPARVKLSLLLAKIETTPGIDASPAASTDAVMTVGLPQIDPTPLESGNRDDVVMGVMGVADRAAPAGWMVSFPVTVEVRGAGSAYAAGNPPPNDVFLRISGLGKTTGFGAGTEFYRYSTLDNGNETATIYGFGGGKVFRLVNCIAQPKLAVVVNQRAFWTFQVTGKLLLPYPIDAAVPVPTFLGANTPPMFHSGAAAIGSWTTTSPSTDPLMIVAADLDFGTEIGELSSAGATDGYVGHYVTDRKVRQSLSVMMPSSGTSDVYGLSRAATGPGGGLGTIPTSWQVGTAQYNRLKIVTGRWAIEAPKKGNRNGLVTADLTGFLVQGSEATSGRELYLLYD